MVIGFLQCKIVVAGGEGELLVGEVGAAPSPVATHCSDRTSPGPINIHMGRIHIFL